MLSAAFNSWREFARLQKGMFEISGKAVRRMRNAGLARGFYSWLAFAEVQRKQEAKMSGAVTRMLNRQLSLAWEQWQSNAAQMAAEQRKLARALTKMQNRMLSAAFNSWREFARLQKGSNVLTRRTLLRTKQDSLFVSLNQWRMLAADMNDTRRKYLLTYSFLTRRHEVIALALWYDTSITKQAVVGLSLVALEHAKNSRSTVMLHLWRSNVRQWHERKAKVTRYLMAMRCQLLRRALIHWSLLSRRKDYLLARSKEAFHLQNLNKTSSMFTKLSKQSASVKRETKVLKIQWTKKPHLHPKVEARFFSFSKWRSSALANKTSACLVQALLSKRRACGKASAFVDWLICAASWQESRQQQQYGHSIFQRNAKLDVLAKWRVWRQEHTMSKFHQWYTERWTHAAIECTLGVWRPWAINRSRYLSSVARGIEYYRLVCWNFGLLRWRSWCTARCQLIGSINAVAAGAQKQFDRERMETNTRRLAIQLEEHQLLKALARTEQALEIDCVWTIWQWHACI